MIVTWLKCQRPLVNLSGEYTEKSTFL